MFNTEAFGHVCDLYRVDYLIIDRAGKVYAPAPVGPHNLIEGLTFDTDTMDGSVTTAAIEKAKGE